ncbi:lysis protein [Lactobacillus sp. LC28-10]|uniref:Lysis protein n=1 Tax=Secundilactobacillus angelensis TaxID=2722706 RepID=A0ABX1KVH7_9LACO|nr:PepSY domain-containing protein [Secundilactobacillus angelensis]MCH5461628.1 PepSY domain-containing protein [Secundilactobacillus angelensis]NLR17923.1 lysis protein [Secundilactobacillus angelensis]
MNLKVILAVSFASLMLVGCGSNNGSKSSQDSASSSTASSSSSQSVKQTTAQKDVSQVKVSVGTAIKTYQKTFANSEITDLSVEQELGQFRYEVEGADDSREYTLKLDANTGKVISKTSERLDADEANGVKRQEALDLNNLIGLTRAVNIAQPKAKGQTATEASLDKESEQTHWEIQFEHQGQETQVKLDAQSGRVITVENDD